MKWNGTTLRLVYLREPGDSFVSDTTTKTKKAGEVRVELMSRQGLGILHDGCLGTSNKPLSIHQIVRSQGNV